MEDSIIEGLKCLNYHGDLSDIVQLKEALSNGQPTKPFVQLVYWLVSELKSFCDLGENVSGEVDTFPLELKGVLRELECPYHSMIGGDGILKSRGKLFTLDYLISELQACRMNFIYPSGTDTTDSMETDTPISNSLVKIIQALNMSLSSNIQTLFNDIENKVSNMLKNLPPGYWQHPLLQKQLTPVQWEKVNQINDAMCQDYKTRRQVLIKRIDVTIQSFNWSEKVKKSSAEAELMYHPLRSGLFSESLLSMVDVLTARADLYALEKTSSGLEKESAGCDMKKVMIGKVSDRGGRPSKVPPPPEMPKFKKRVADTPRGGGRGGGRGGRGGDGGGRGSDGRRGGGWGGQGRRGGGKRQNFDQSQRGGGEQKMYYS